MLGLQESRIRTGAGSDLFALSGGIEVGPCEGIIYHSFKRLSMWVHMLDPAMWSALARAALPQPRPRLVWAAFKQ